MSSYLFYPRARNPRLLAIYTRDSCGSK